MPPQTENKAIGTQIEKYRAEERGGERTPEAWFDVEGGDGTIVEVKSTMVRLESGRIGRYQIEGENHRNLVDHGGVYDFVLRDGDHIADETTLSASEVERIRKEHNLKYPDGGKLKVPWTYVHNYSE